MTRTASSRLIALLTGLAIPLAGLAQPTPYDPAWYEAGRPYVKLNVAADGIYRVDLDSLASHLPPGSAVAASLRLFENGKEIPIDYQGSGGQVQSGDYFLFVGRRNTGEDEDWVYGYDRSLRGSVNLSLYTDTTSYFLTWGADDGLRYRDPGSVVSGTDTVFTFRTSNRFETIKTYNFGEPRESGNPLYTLGEGWTSVLYRHTTDNRISDNHGVRIDGLVRDASDTLKLEVKMVGGTAGLHKAILSARYDPNEMDERIVLPLDSVEWFDYGFATLRASIPQSKVFPERIGTIRTIVGTDNTHGTLPNRSYMFYVEAEYTALLSPDAGPVAFSAPSSGNLVYRTSTENEMESIVLKPADGLRYSVEPNGSFADASTEGDSFWISATEDLLTPVVVADGPSDLANAGNRYDYVIIAAPPLIPSAGQLKAFRESVDGGSHTVLIANVQDVYDQFDYGRSTPVAIQRFIDHTSNWAVPAEFVALWGDALYPDTRRERLPWEVPSFGNASSDGWLAMFDEGNPENKFESVALGRIPIRTNDQGSGFVQKLRTYVSAPFGKWQKQLTLMAGGINTTQQFILHNATALWGTQVTEGAFGADVTYFLKSESSALDPTFLDSVDATIARGTSWLAFFGHSAADAWEIVTTPPTAFNNADFLPLALSLGCYTGAFARGDGLDRDPPVYAELLVTENENGAIAHFGGSTSSSSVAVGQMAGEVYATVFDDDERILGHAMRIAKRNMLERYGADESTVETAMQYNLIGDPATFLKLPTKPDFDIAQRSLTVSPTVPVAGIDSVLSVAVEIENLGKVPQDSVTATLTHFTPGNIRTDYSRKLAPFPLQTHLEFEVAIDVADLGTHRFELRVDPGFEYEEEVETNNYAETSHTVFAAGVIQLYPPDFGLVTSRQPALQLGAASTSGEELLVFIELDTTATFDSPLLVRDQVSLTSLLDWTPNTSLVNSRSYFWRVRVDDPSGESVWTTSSFTVREDLPASGWFQQGPQFAGNEHGRFLEFEDNEWRFKQFDIDIRLVSAVNVGGALAANVGIAGAQYNRGQDGFGVVILDVRGNVKDGAFDNFVVYKHRNEAYDPVAELARLDSLLSTAQVGEYVLVNSFLVRRADDAEGLPDEARQLFRDLGSTKIDSVGLGDMWNFAVRIGEPQPIVDDYLDYTGPSSPVNHTTEFQLFINFGASETLSPLVGPSTAWQSLQWSADIPVEGSTIDVSLLSVDGDTLVKSTMSSPGGSQTVDLATGEQAIDADLYPHLRLSAFLKDESLQGAPQLRNWYLGFETVAELSLDASELAAALDTLAEGDVYSPSVIVINAAGASVDSVFVVYDLTDANNVTSTASIDTLVGLSPNARVESSATINTFGLIGLNWITVTVKQKDEREPIPYNNTAIGSFFVVGDSEPPMFAVTVDGVEYPSDPRVITNTDDPTLPFLDATPVIEITLTDENAYQPLADSNLITILLDGRRIAYSRPDVTFEPGDATDNEARLTFSPNFSSEDTTHTLKIYAEDVAGNPNPSREDPYTFSFRVQSEAEIESLYPYPNPMNTFTAFMFRLRGADPSLVEDLRIRVFTISGRLVREFDLVAEPYLLDAGGLQIGWNRLTWDGTDQDGDLLANGVYLYRVYLRAEGKELTVNNESGIEKIAIIR